MRAMNKYEEQKSKEKEKNVTSKRAEQIVELSRRDSAFFFDSSDKLSDFRIYLSMEFVNEQHVVLYNVILRSSDS